MSNSSVAPFVKWAGGKRQLIPQIKERMPKQYKDYYEPFVGGGAVIFELLPANALINDINKALINAYKQICNAPKVFMKAVNKLDEEMWDAYNCKGEKLGYQIPRSMAKSLSEGVYHIAVMIYVKRADGCILATQRSRNKTNPLKWEVTGGSILAGETPVEGAARELAEETGCVVEVGEQYLTIKEHYDDWLWVSHYYICNYIGKTERILAQREYEVGLEPRWISLEKAIDIFSKYQDYADKDKMKQGAYFREYKALLSYIEK